MSQPLVGNWNYPTAIRFGVGRIRELPEACKAVGLRRPLLVTDPGLARLPMIADAMTALRKAGIEVALFSDVKPNPVESNVEAGLAQRHHGVGDHRQPGEARIGDQQRPLQADRLAGLGQLADAAGAEADRGRIVPVADECLRRWGHQRTSISDNRAFPERAPNCNVRSDV